MKNSEVVRKIKEIVKKREQLYADPRFVRVMRFFVSKGLLITDDAIAPSSAKIHLNDALWVGEQLEPRVLEVLPAALLRFPRSFLGTQNMPKDLSEVLKFLTHQEKTGPSLRNVPYEKLMAWTNIPLQDRRTVPLRTRKVTRSFRIRPEAAARLQAIALKNKTSLSESVERLIMNSGE